MSAESLENYLQMDSMEEGTSKDELQILVDSVGNNDYVTKHLPTIVCHGSAGLLQATVQILICACKCNKDCAQLCIKLQAHKVSHESWEI